MVNNASTNPSFLHLMFYTILLLFPGFGSARSTTVAPTANENVAHTKIASDDDTVVAWFLRQRDQPEMGGDSRTPCLNNVCLNGGTCSTQQVVPESEQRKKRLRRRPPHLHRRRYPGHPRGRRSRAAQQRDHEDGEENRGEKLTSVINYECICPEGFVGDLCERVCPLACANGGHCRLGREQRKNMSSSSVNNHENDGEDEKEKRLFYCECEKGFTGNRCEEASPIQANCAIAGCAGQTDVCLFDPTTQDFACAPDFCKLTPAFRDDGGGTGSACRNNATCRPVKNGFVCECHDGFSGKLCEEVDHDHYHAETTTITKEQQSSQQPEQQQQLDICSSSPLPKCQNGGQCLVVDLATFECLCLNGFEGILCEESSPTASLSSITPVSSSTSTTTTITTTIEPMTTIFGMTTKKPFLVTMLTEMFPIIESEITTTPPITIIEKNEETATTATTTTAKTTTEAESPLFSIPSPTTTIDTLLTDHIRPEKEGEDEDKQVLEKEDEEEPLVDCRAEDGGCSNAGVCSAPYSSDKSVEARRITESVMTTLMNKNNNSRHRFDGEDEQTAQSTNLSSVIFRCQCPEGFIGNRCNFANPCVNTSGLENSHHNCAHGICVRPKIVVILAGSKKNQRRRETVVQHDCQCFLGFTGPQCTLELPLETSVSLTSAVAIGAVMTIVCVALCAALYLLAVCTRRKRANQGTYSPSVQEVISGGGVVPPKHQRPISGMPTAVVTTPSANTIKTDQVPPAVATGITGPAILLTGPGGDTAVVYHRGQPPPSLLLSRDQRRLRLQSQPTSVASPSSTAKLCEQQKADSKKWRKRM